MICERASEILTFSIELKSSMYTMVLTGSLHIVSGKRIHTGSSSLLELRLILFLSLKKFKAILQWLELLAKV